MSIDDIKNGIKFWYDLGNKERVRRGSVGREWAIKNGFTAQNMADGIINSLEKCFKNFVGTRKLNIVKTTNNEKIKYPEGVIR